MNLRGLLFLAAGVLIPAVVLASMDPPVDDRRWSDRYDRYFKKYSKRYFGPGMDWHWFKAQGIAESGLKEGAKSRAGAIGVMQIMPATFEEIKSKNPHFVDIADPHWNIAAAIYYDRKLYRRWKKKEIPTDERLSFTFASYTAGLNKMRRVVKKAAEAGGDAQAWEHVEPYSPPETRHYVRRINRLMGSE